MIAPQPPGVNTPRELFFNPPPPPDSASLSRPAAYSSLDARANTPSPHSPQLSPASSPIALAYLPLSIAFPYRRLGGVPGGRFPQPGGGSTGPLAAFRPHSPRLLSPTQLPQLICPLHTPSAVMVIRGDYEGIIRADFGGDYSRLRGTPAAGAAPCRQETAAALTRLTSATTLTTSNTPR